METTNANPAAVALGRLGGRATSAKKTAANRAKAAAYWDRVRAGLVTHRGRGKAAGAATA